MHKLCATLGIFVLALNHIGPLAREKQNGESLLVADERKLLSLGKRFDERVGPEMLVDVDLHGAISRFSINFMKISIQMTFRPTTPLSRPLGQYR